MSHPTAHQDHGVLAKLERIAELEERNRGLAAELAAVKANNEALGLERLKADSERNALQEKYDRLLQESWRTMTKLKFLAWYRGN